MGKEKTDAIPETCKPIPELKAYLEKEKKTSSVEDMQFAALNFLVGNGLKEFFDHDFVVGGEHLIVDLEMQSRVILQSDPKAIQFGILLLKIRSPKGTAGLDKHGVTFEVKYGYNKAEGRIFSFGFIGREKKTDKFYDDFDQNWLPRIEHRFRKFFGIGLKVKTKDQGERDGTVLDAFKAIKTRCITNEAAKKRQEMDEKLKAEKLLKSLED